MKSTALKFFIAFQLIVAQSFAAPGLTLQGRLLNPDGSETTAQDITFVVQIRSPGSENCLLFQEQHSISTSQTGGLFSITIGQGTRAAASVDGGYSLEQIFANRGTLDFSSVSSACAVGTSYTPGAKDERKLVYSFNDNSGSGWQTVPVMSINYVPMAIESLALGGYNSSNFLRVESAGAPAAAPALTPAQATELMNLLTAASTVYVKPGSAVFTAAPQWSGTPVAGDDLANKAYVDAQVAAGLPNVGTAGTYTKVTTDAQGRVTSGATLSETDIPSLTTAGKVDGGAINAGTIGGSASVNTSGNIVTSGTVSAGTISGNQLRVYNGADYIQFTAPALGGSNVTYTLPATAGTPGYVLRTDGAGVLSWVSPTTGSVTSVTSGGAPITVGGTATAPTISIAQSNTTTSGYLSSADWNTFNNKLGTGSSFSGDVSGTSSTMSVDKIKGKDVVPVAYSSGQFLRYDGTNWVNAALTAGDIPAVDSAKITDGTIVNDDVNASANIARSKLASGSNNHVLINDGSGVMSSEAQLAVSRGGTGLSSLGAHRVLVSNLAGDAISPMTCGLDQVIKFDGSGYASCGTDVGSAGTPLSALAAAAGINTIDNTNYAQTWNWSTLNTQTAMSINANAATTGSVLDIASSSASLNSTNGLLHVANTGASTSGTVARIQSNSTAGSGLTVLANGNVGVGTASPGSKLYVQGDATVSGQMTVSSILSSGASLSTTGIVSSPASSPSVSSVSATVNLASADANNFAGHKVDTTYQTTDTSSGVNSSIAGSFLKLGAGTVSLGAGISGVGTVAGGTATKLVGVMGKVETAMGTTGSGISLLAQSNTSAGTMTNNYGLYLESQTAGTNNYQIYSVGTAASYFAGNIGLGTLSPASKLHAHSTGTSATSQFTTAATGALVSDGFHIGWDDALGAVILNKEAGALVLGTSGAESMRINSLGNIGIANINPANAKLEIGTAGTSLGTMRLAGDSSGYVQIQPASAAGSWTFTLPADDGDNGYVLQTNGSGVTSWVAAPSGSPSLSSLAAASATNTIDNTNYAQTWNWSTLNTQTAMSINANAATTGSVLDISSSSASLNSTNGLLRVANTGASTSGTVARIQSNSTADSGLTVLANGNVGVGTASPGTAMEVKAASGTNALFVGNTTNSRGIRINATDGTSLNKLEFLDSAGSPLIHISSSNGGTNNSEFNSKSILYFKVGLSGYSGSTGSMYDFGTNTGNVGLTDNNSHQTFMWIRPKINQSGTAGYNGVLIDVNEITTGSGAKSILKLNSASTTKFDFTSSGYAGIGLGSPNTALDINGAISVREMAAPSVSPADQGRIYFDSTDNKFKVSENGGGYVNLISTGGGALSALTAASATNTIDNTNYAQTWNWSTLSTETAMSINANAATTGSVLDIASSSASLNSTNGLLRVANTGASTSGTVARIQSNSTADSGLTVLADGNVGIGGLPTSSQRLKVSQYSTDVASSKSALAVNTYIISGSANSSDFYGTDSSVNYVSAQAHTGTLTGVFGGVSVNSFTGGNINRTIGVDGFSNVSGVSTYNVTNLIGVRGGVNQGGGNLVTSSAISILASANTKSTGTMTNNYGLYLEAQTAGSNNYQIYSAGTAASYFAGPIGIGTAPSATEKIQVQVAGSSAALNILRGASDKLSLGTDSAAWTTRMTNGKIATYGYDLEFEAGGGSGDQVMLFKTIVGGTTAERMRIDSDGFVGIGTNDPTQRLHVFGNLRVQGSTDCTLGNGAGGTNCSSDIRLKDNIKIINNPIEKINKLRGVEFDWNQNSQSPGKHSIGVIAQEVERQFPSAVIEDSSTGYKKVDYAVLVAPLIEAVKQLWKQTSQIIVKLTQHENEIEELKKQNELLKLEIENLRQAQKEQMQILKQMQTQ